MKDEFTRCIYAFIHRDFRCAWVPVCYCEKNGNIVDKVKYFKQHYGINNLKLRLIHDSEIERNEEFYIDFFEDN